MQINRDVFRTWSITTNILSHGTGGTNHLAQVVFVLLRGTREALAQRAEDNKLVVTLHCGESHKEGQTKCRFLKRVLSSVHVPELTGDTSLKNTFCKLFKNKTVSLKEFHRHYDNQPR